MMLDFLETGKALYVLAAICGLGLAVRLVARNLYKRLIKETNSMRCFRTHKYTKKSILHTYLGFNAQSSPMDNERLFGEFIKSVLPLTCKLSKCSLCYEQHATKGREEIIHFEN